MSLYVNSTRERVLLRSWDIKITRFLVAFRDTARIFDESNPFVSPSNLDSR
jgi:hypothetical protein